MVAVREGECRYAVCSRGKGQREQGGEAVCTHVGCSRGAGAVLIRRLRPRGGWVGGSRGEGGREQAGNESQ